MNLKKTILLLKERFLSVKTFMILQILPYKSIFYTVMVCLSILFFYFDVLRVSWTCLVIIFLFEKEVNVPFQQYLGILEEDRKTVKKHWETNFHDLTVILRVNYVAICFLVAYIFTRLPLIGSLEYSLCLPQGPY